MHGVNARVLAKGIAASFALYGAKRWLLPYAVKKGLPLVARIGMRCGLFILAKKAGASGPRQKNEYSAPLREQSGARAEGTPAPPAARVDISVSAEAMREFTQTPSWKGLGRVLKESSLRFVP